MSQLTRCQHPQFVWFLGHTLLLACATRYFLAFITLSASSHVLSYRLAFLGSLITYGVVIFKTYSNSQSRGKLDAAFAARVWTDENVQYFLLSVYWFYFCKPLTIALVPYTIFSAFHFLTYLRTNILPTFDPTALTPGATSPAAKLSHMTQNWVKANYDGAMQLVSRIEFIGVGGRVLVGVITLRTSFTTLLVFGSFLRYRYFTSAYTRTQFIHFTLRVDHLVADSRVPPMIRHGWNTVKGLTSRYLGNPGLAAQSRPSSQGQSAQRKTQ